MAYLQRMPAEFESTPVIAAEISRTHHLIAATMHGSKKHKLYILCIRKGSIQRYMHMCVHVHAVRYAAREI